MAKENHVSEDIERLIWEHAVIRILHVVSSLNINAGMMSVVMNYYRHIDRNEIQFDFLYLIQMKETHLAEIERLGGKTYYMPYRTWLPRDQKKIREFFQAHKGEYAAVHCHPIWASEIVAHAAKQSGIAHVIQHSHSTRYSEKKKNARRNRFLMRFISFFATDYIACNSEAAELFGKRIAESARVFLLPNAIDVTEYVFLPSERQRVRDEFGLSENSFVCGNVGRLSQEKNPSFIISIFEEIKALREDSKLILVGDGSLRKELETLIREKNLQNSVILTGKRRDVQALLASFDVFLMPSLFEGTPISALEARSSGLPCLISDTITKSIAMPGVFYIPLEAGPDAWAEKAILVAEAQKEQNRYDYSAVINAGFDIRREAHKLQDYYLGLR